jgi:hypothetical protein
LRSSSGDAVTSEKPRKGTRSAARRRFDAVAQLGFPFAFGRYATAVGRFRALARNTRGADRPWLHRWLLRTTMAVTWPVGALMNALEMQTALRDEGKPAGPAVLMNMYWLALRHSIPPLEYKLYGFIDPTRRALMHEYVYWNDLPALTALNRRRRADNRDVQDKARFARICAEHQLPHIETLAVFEQGRQTFPADPFVPGAEFLWSKALALSGGAGGTRWRSEGDGIRDDSGRPFSLEAFRGELAKRDTIVQRLVANHPAIAGVTNGRLAALRVVTGMNREGRAELITTMLTLAHGPYASAVGAIMCSIEQGCVRKAALRGDFAVERHPDTGAVIPGLEIPFWRECVALACKAHSQAFARFAFLGWDFALTADGPVILETNSGWGALFHQMLDGPLGATAFSGLVSEYV